MRLWLKLIASLPVWIVVAFVHGIFIWLGWKVLPADYNPTAKSLPPDDYRYPGAGFAIQLKRRP